MSTSSLVGMPVRQIRATAERLAREALDEHWPSYFTLPVDPVKIARSMGVEVYSADLGAEVFGMIRGTEDGAEIYVDRAQPPNRYRFTVAHECGHYVEHTQRGAGANVAYVDRRTDPGGYDPEETFANHFAGALLMPREAVKHWVGTGRATSH